MPGVSETKWNWTLAFTVQAEDDHYKFYANDEDELKLWLNTFNWIIK